MMNVTFIYRVVVKGYVNGAMADLYMTRDFVNDIASAHNYAMALEATLPEYEYTHINVIIDNPNRTVVMG